MKQKRPPRQQDLPLLYKPNGLYRAVFHFNDRIARVTFAARTPQEADDYAEEVLFKKFVRPFDKKATILIVKPC